LSRATSSFGRSGNTREWEDELGVVVVAVLLLLPLPLLLLTELGEPLLFRRPFRGASLREDDDPSDGCCCRVLAGVVALEGFVVVGPSVWFSLLLEFVGERGGRDGGSFLRLRLEEEFRRRGGGGGGGFEADVSALPERFGWVLPSGLFSGRFVSFGDELAVGLSTSGAVIGSDNIDVTRVAMVDVI
jgi:hypothetical protein